MATDQLSELEWKFIDDLREIGGQEFPMVRECSLWSELFLKEGLIKNQRYESRHVGGVAIGGPRDIPLWYFDMYYPLTDKGKELYRILTKEKKVKIIPPKRSI